MSCIWSIRSSILAVLLMLPQILVADVTTSGPQNACSFCYTSKCPTTKCLQTCTSACQENYYPSSLVCETPSTTTTASTLTTTTTKTTTETTTEKPTTTTPATTTTTTTTTTPTTSPTTIRLPIETNHDAANTNPVTPAGSPVGRRRRQAPLETTEAETETINIATVATTRTDATTVAITRTHAATVAITRTDAATIATRTTTVKTSPTTLSLTTIVCRLCSLESCILCQDDSQNNSICATCQDGYSPSSDQKSCSKDGLSVGAIVGIVVGVVCFVAIAVVVAIILVRRFWWKRDAMDREHARPSRRRSIKSINSLPLSKINTNDRRYSEGPICERRTHTNENDSEQYEIGKLGAAPTPPAEGTSRRYDMLKSTNKDDPQSYSPLEVPIESRYANCAKEEQKKNIYANQKIENTPGASASDKPGAHGNTVEASVSSEVVELYETFDTTQHEDIQEEYVNIETPLGQQANTRAAAETQVAYYNDSNSIEDNVYENT